MTGRPRGIAGAVLWRPNGSVLLQHRDDAPGVKESGKWSLFGGGMEPGEDPEATMLRELEEELGFVPQRYQPFLTLHSEDAVFHLFLAHIDQPIGALELREGQGFAYLEPGAALAGYDLSDTARMALEVLQLYRGFRRGRGCERLID